MALQIELDQAEDHWTLTLSGELDYSECAAFRMNIDRILKASPPATIVDLSRLDYLDSSGLGLLLSLSNRALVLRHFAEESDRLRVRPFWLVQRRSGDRQSSLRGPLLACRRQPRAVPPIILAGVRGKNDLIRRSRTGGPWCSGRGQAPPARVALKEAVWAGPFGEALALLVRNEPSFVVTDDRGDRNHVPPRLNIVIWFRRRSLRPR